MTHVSINSSLGLGLELVRGPVVVTDENGLVIGQFIPAAQPVFRPEDGCPFSDQEVQARMAHAIANPREGRPLAEFLAEVERRT